MATVHSDTLVSPDHALSQEADGWLRHGVLELTPAITASAVAPAVAPKVRRDTRKCTTRKAALADGTVLSEQIRLLAYQLFERRGCEHGHDVEDWLRAEAIVLSRTRAFSV